MSAARFLEEAETEFLLQIRYYAELQPNGVAKFREAVEAATVRALNFPKAGLQYLARTRRVFVRGHPFFLVYREAALRFSPSYTSRAAPRLVRRGSTATLARKEPR